MPISHMQFWKLAFDSYFKKKKVASLYKYILKMILPLSVDPKSGLKDQKIILDVVKKIIS